jgi:hypothetical protein
MLINNSHGVATLTPPGHYMLFPINAKGLPSIAKIVRIL